MRDWRKCLLLGIVLICTVKLFSTDYTDGFEYANWYNLDPEKDHVIGASIDKAYAELLKGKASSKVVVAVIDGGIDIHHEDLKDFIWVNTDEIPGNGKDDDNNGYIDDVNGWNFIGNAEGVNIDSVPLELTRLYGYYNRMFDGLDADSLLSSNNLDYDYYLDLRFKFEEESFFIEWKLKYLNKQKSLFLLNDSIIKSVINVNSYAPDTLANFKFEKDSPLDSVLSYLIEFYAYHTSLQNLNEDILEYQNILKHKYNPDLNCREIIGDDEHTWTTQFYGNNDVTGPDAEHGTMVSGIIGAARNNNLGVNGIANNIEIMPIRTIPNGDEWDKDVASSILYAVENGAQIINMSFGKEYSPQKHFVDSIVSMVDDNNVLLIQASGNDNYNIDENENFPNKFSPEGKVLANNWITVGASTKSARQKGLVADYSNYGKYSVDLFAPGSNIVLCTPGNTYTIASGTSFASPVVTGIAALIKSYYPEFTAAEIKSIILDSVYKGDFVVKKPGTFGKDAEFVDLSALCKTGGIVNAYKALKLAGEKSQKKNTQL